MSNQSLFSISFVLNFAILFAGWMVATAIDWMNFGDVSVIAVDWSGLAGGGYVSLTSFGGIKDPAEYIVELLKLIITACEIPVEGIEEFFKKISIAGHSLGSHIAGWAGHLVYKAYKYLIGSIFGLDPAGPGYYVQLICTRSQFRLDRRNALFVQVLHTDIDNLGNADILGHADYFAEGGKCQPGCGCGLGFQRTQCNHVRAIHYFRASMYLNAIGYKCEGDVTHLTDLLLDRDHDHKMDYYGIHTKKLEGIFYLLAHSKEPFFHVSTDRTHIPSHQVKKVGFLPLRKFTRERVVFEKVTAPAIPAVNVNMDVTQTVAVAT